MMIRPRKVIKRDGTAVEFDETKITEAIFAAAKAVGGHDYSLAKGLTERVTAFISEHFTADRIYIEDIQDAVEKVLIESGHAKTAKEFILYRERRHEMRKGLLVRERTFDPDSSVVVDMRSSEKLLPWDKSRISSALIREHQIPVQLACDIASAVENKIFTSGITRISTGLIRELVDNEMFERGFAGLLRDNTMISFPTFNLNQYLKHGVGKTSANPALFNDTVSRDLLRQYALQNIFSSEVSESHGRCDIHIHHLGETNRVMRKRHCGPVPSDSPQKVLSNLAFRLAELQPYFVFYPRVDYFNVLFAPLFLELDQEELKASFREFLFMIRQLNLISSARGKFEFDIYGFIPRYIDSLATDELFPPVGPKSSGKTYNDLYRESLRFARLFLEEVRSDRELAGMLKFNVHLTRFFNEDESERELLESFYEFSRENGNVEFLFGTENGDVDNRMELIGGGDIEFHSVSLNLARFFFEIPVRGLGEVKEEFKYTAAVCIESAIEKLDFLASLMRRPGQILWKLGSQAEGEPLFDPLNSFASLRFSGIVESFLFSRSFDFNAGEILAEFLEIARDIIESKGNEYPFAVRMLPGEVDSASFRFAEADLERYPEKRDLFQNNSDGRLYYEGTPEFYGDDPVPIGESLAYKIEPYSCFSGKGRIAVFNGAQVDGFNKFICFLDDILEWGNIQSFVFETGI